MPKSESESESMAKVKPCFDKFLKFRFSMVKLETAYSILELVLACLKACFDSSFELSGPPITRPIFLSDVARNKSA